MPVSHVFDANRLPAGRLRPIGDVMRITLMRSCGFKALARILGGGGSTPTQPPCKAQLTETDALRMKREVAKPSGACDASDTGERRSAADRRRRTLHALMYGSFHPRRRTSRRTGETTLAGVDWHEPQWLAIAMLIVLLSSVDAALTLALIQRGAYEINPLMASFVGGSALAFTVVKIGLTAGGVVLLTLLVRTRAFGKIPVSLLLYLLLAGYGTLVVYELRLLGETSLTF